MTTSEIEQAGLADARHTAPQAVWVSPPKDTDRLVEAAFKPSESQKQYLVPVSVLLDAVLDAALAPDERFSKDLTDSSIRMRVGANGDLVRADSWFTPVKLRSAANLAVSEGLLPFNPYLWSAVAARETRQFAEFRDQVIEDFGGADEFYSQGEASDSDIAVLTVRETKQKIKDGVDASEFLELELSRGVQEQRAGLIKWLESRVAQ